MSYSLIILPLAKRNLSRVVRERENTDTKRALLAEISASLEKIEVELGRAVRVSAATTFRVYSSHLPAREETAWLSTH